MSQVIVFLLLGIGAGGLIAGIGMGVVLSYRGAGVINLTTGAVAMLAGYFFWSIRSGKFATIPAVPAVILTLLFAVVIGVLFDLLVPCTIDADGVKHGTFDFVIKQVTEAENVTPESLAVRV